MKMKKYSIFLMLILLLGVTGCTINISDKKDYDDQYETDEVSNDVEEEINSIGKTSTVDSPLGVGEVGRASKHNAVLDAYQDVDVKIVSISETPLEVVNEYNTQNIDDQFVVDDKYQLVVLDYDVTLVDFETESFGTSVGVDVEITNINGDNFIVDDEKQVIVVKKLYEDVGVVGDETGTVTIAFQIPKDVTNYLVKLGTNSHTIAYYKI